MGARGPKPKPMALKLLRGNPGKRKLAGREPQADAAVPERPEDLSPGALAAWDRIVPQLFAMGVLGRIDREALVLWCVTWDLWKQAAAVIRKHGSTFEVHDELGNVSDVKSRPEVGHYLAHLDRLVKIGRDFGLTPSSRAGLCIAPPASDPLAAYLGAT